jgi:hypothetical protein
MAGETDFNGAKPVKTLRDNEFVITIASGESGSTATRKVSVVQVGDAFAAGTNDSGLPTMVKDSAGNAKILELDAAGLLPVGVNKVSDGTHSLVISADGEANVRLAKAQAADGATAPTETVQVGGKDPSGNLQTLRTDTAGNIFAVVIPSAGRTPVCEHFSHAALAVNAEQLFFYVIPSGKKFTGAVVLGGGRGATSVRWGTSADGLAASAVKGFAFQDPKENLDHAIPSLELVGDGTNAIFVGVTNLDGASNTVYATLQGAVE